MSELLSVPEVEPVEFERNMIRLAVCELRFPTLLELEKNVPPIEFQQALRKDYPLYERKISVTVEGAQASSQTTHLFQSKKRNWTVALRPFSVALETPAYSRFEDLSDRLGAILSKVLPLLDADFFTRVGLRYINVLPVTQDRVEGWVNPELVQPLVKGAYGKVDSFWQEIRGRCSSGRYSLRHGLAPDDSGAPPKEYTLDFDLYEEAVDAKDAIGLAGRLHREAFHLFMWTLGDSAKKHMGKAKPKVRSR